MGERLKDEDGDAGISSEGVVVPGTLGPDITITKVKIATKAITAIIVAGIQNSEVAPATAPTTDLPACNAIFLPNPPAFKMFLALPYAPEVLSIGPCLCSCFCSFSIPYFNNNNLR